MASILSLKRRIQAAQNVSKTTKAMQMISASKMKRAQEAALSSRPYVEKLISMAGSVASKIDEKTKNLYITPKAENGKTLFIAISPDKGLCGGLITNLVREFLMYNKNNQDSFYLTIGKKIELQVAQKSREVIASFTFGNTTPTLDLVFPIIKLIDEYYLSGKVDNVKILSTHFTNIFSQTPKITKILPIILPEVAKNDNTNYIFEPNVSDILTPLLNHYLEMIVFQHLLENFVSEQASRMLAMQNATDNANDIIDDLKLEYNKTRQAKITSEILDISSANIQN